MEERMQMEQEVTLEQMLEARERRVQRQRTLLDRYGQSLICLTMNVAGPVKNSLLIRRGFFWAEELLLGQLAGRGISCLHRERYGPATGNEGFYVVSGDAAALKQLTVEMEEHCEIGCPDCGRTGLPEPAVRGLRDAEAGAGGPEKQRQPPGYGHLYLSEQHVCPVSLL